ncbi:MAG: hypothetical protein HRU23_03550 [Gammaproteobacteria bacterium]|nr:hypothetical protein [Gammaproteobacteria bacterium]
MISIRALNKHIIINRLSQLSLAILLLLFLASLLWFSDQQSQQLRQQQQQAVTELLKQQLGLAATMGLKLNQQQQLQWLAQSLSESPLLNGVWIHRADGTLMAESTKAMPGESILLVTEVRQDKLLGYLKLSLNKNEFIAPIVAIQQQQLQWHQWSLVLAGIIGFLLARALSQKRARYQLRNSVWRNQKKQAAKQQLIAHNSPDISEK